MIGTKATVLIVAALAPGEWNYIGDGAKPATLAECPGANITISQSSGALWQKYCYRSGDKTFSAPKRKGKI